MIQNFCELLSLANKVKIRSSLIFQLIWYIIMHNFTLVTSDLSTQATKYVYRCKVIISRKCDFRFSRRTRTIPLEKCYFRVTLTLGASLFFSTTLWDRVRRNSWNWNRASSLVQVSTVAGEYLNDLSKVYLFYLIKMFMSKQTMTQRYAGTSYICTFYQFIIYQVHLC